MSLRLKLLLISLVTLVLPWAGCQYAREMEFVLKEGEQQSLDAVAKTIASSLQGRGDLLYRSEDAGQYAKRQPLDLQPVPLPGEPFLDGYADEWPQQPKAWTYVSHGKDRLGILTGVHERMFYALLDVTDDKLVFDGANANPLDGGALGDRIWLGFEDPDGSERQVFVSAASAGVVRARRIETRELGQQVAVEEPRIEGAWQPTSHGYRVELRIPLSMMGSRFGVLVDDRDERGALPSSYGTLRGDDLHTRGRLIVASPDLTSYLEQFIQPGLRLILTRWRRS